MSAYTVRIETTSGRTTNVGPFKTRAAADEHVKLFNTWAYVARIWVLPVRAAIETTTEEAP